MFGLETRIIHGSNVCLIKIKAQISLSEQYPREISNQIQSYLLNTTEWVYIAQSIKFNRFSPLCCQERLSRNEWMLVKGSKSYTIKYHVSSPPFNRLKTQNYCSNIIKGTFWCAIMASVHHRIRVEKKLFIVLVSIDNDNQLLHTKHSSTSSFYR